MLSSFACIDHCKPDDIEEAEGTISITTGNLKSLFDTTAESLLTVIMKNCQLENGEEMKKCIQSELTKLKDSLCSVKRKQPKAKVVQSTCSKSLPVTTAVSHPQDKHVSIVESEIPHKRGTKRSHPDVQPNLPPLKIPCVETVKGEQPMAEVVQSTFSKSKCKTDVWSHPFEVVSRGPQDEHISSDESEIPLIGTKRCNSDLQLNLPPSKVLHVETMHVQNNKERSTTDINVAQLVTDMEDADAKKSTCGDPKYPSTSKRVCNNGDDHTIKKLVQTKLHTTLPAQSSAKTKPILHIKPVRPISKRSESSPKKESHTASLMEKHCDKKRRRSRCSEKEKHLCPVCSIPDCGECKNCR